MGNSWRNNLFHADCINTHLLQSPLYSASKHIPLTTVVSSKERIIETYNRQEIIVTASQFSQFDLAVVFAARKLQECQKRFENMRVSLADLIHAMKRYDGGNTRKLVIQSLKKYRDFNTCLQSKTGVEFEGHKVNKIIEEAQNHLTLSFNEEYLSKFYEHDKICKININKFLSLPLGLQSWLYGFYCSAPTTSSIHLDSLHAISGSNYKNAYDFKKAVKMALKELEQRNIISWRHGVTRDGIVFWEIKNL